MVRPSSRRRFYFQMAKILSMTKRWTVETVCGADIGPLRDELSALRIDVFRAWPYLYDGDAAYEANYIERYVDTPGAALIVARDGADIIGAATAMPLDQELPDFKAPFVDRGYDLSEIFYFGESVLRPAYRGQGLGHVFFDRREAHARSAGAYRQAAFCAVVRADNDARRPEDYRPLDGFWHKRGYAPIVGLQTQFAWREIGDSSESAHAMQFWLGRL